MKKLLLIFVTQIFVISVVSAQTKEKQAEFNGGESGMYTYLGKTLQYPPKARDSCIVGTVILKFIIDKIGNVDSIELIHSVHPLLDKEAIRVVKSTNGQWTPASINDSLVNMKYALPIKFSVKNAGCKDSDYYYNLGIKYFEKGDFESAIKAYKNAIRINPNDIDALYNCAVANLKNSDIDSACYYLFKIKEGGKHDADALIEKYCKK